METLQVKKLPVIFIIILLGSGILFYLSKKDGDKPLKLSTNTSQYKNTGWGFSFNYPEEWTFSENSNTQDRLSATLALEDSLKD